MTVRGTSNGTTASTTKTVRQATWEVAPDGGQGGCPLGVASQMATGPFTALREIDNPASGAGTYFTPGSEWLYVGVPQTLVVPV